MGVSEALSVLGFEGVLSVPVESELRAAYRKLAKKLHPDVSGGETEKDFQRVTEAYDFLRSRAGQPLSPRLKHYSLFDIGF